MSNTERKKWDERYRAGAYENRAHPTALLTQWLPQLMRGRALDVACGAGRNALYLAANGFAVDAVDISAVALERARGATVEQRPAIHWLCLDLDTQQLPAARYDLIVWVRYIHRTLMPSLLERLAPGGTLLCEQHLATEAVVAGPTNPAFRLQPGELIRSATGLQTRYHYEGLMVDPDGRTVALAQVVGCAD